MAPKFIVPASSTHVLVFPKEDLTSSNKFDRGFYTPELTGGRASYESVEQFLKEAEAITDERLKYNWIIEWVVTLALLISLGLFIRFVEDSDSGSSGWLIAAFVIVWLILFCCCGATLQGTKQRLKEEIACLIEKYRGTFAANGLTWTVPEDFPKWIELWKTYLPQPQSQPQLIAQVPGQVTVNVQAYQPPVQYQ